MQVQNDCSVGNYNTSFKRIRSIKCAGLYKKQPQYANKLIEAFKQNEKAMEFCKKYDVDILGG